MEATCVTVRMVSDLLWMAELVMVMYMYELYHTQSIDIHLVCMTDVDECAESLSDCDDICINMIGSYVCDCNPGSHLGSDQRSCEPSKSVVKPCNTLRLQIK